MRWSPLDPQIQPGGNGGNLGDLMSSPGGFTELQWCPGRAVVLWQRAGENGKD